MRERENFMSIGFNFNNKALQSFVEKYDLKKTTVDVKGNKVRVDYDGDGRYDETINFNSKDIKYSYKEFDKENTATKKVGKYTVIDYDGDGRYDAKIKSKKLTKDNMSNPITLKGSSREVQELTEQRFALEYAYSAAIGRDVPDLKEGQKIKKLIAEIDKKLDKYGAGVGTAEFNKKLDEILPQAKKPVETVEEVVDEAPEEVVENAPVKETPVEEAAEEETGYKKGSQLKVTNPNNPNGAIDGKLEDFEQNADGMITKFSIKSDKSGKTFTYEYDAATKRYVNRAENKYYIMQEDGTLLRDNKLGRSAAPVPPVKPAEVKDEIIEQSEKAAAAITMKDVKPYGKGQFIDKDGKIYKLGKDGKFEHVACSNDGLFHEPFVLQSSAKTVPSADNKQPAADALKRAQSTFRSGGEFKVVKTYPDGSFDMSYDFGSWWNGGSGIRHYDKNGGYLGKAKKEAAAPAKTTKSETKEKIDLTKFPAVETLANGYSKRIYKNPKIFFYFDKNGYEITEDQYEQAKNA